MTVRIYGGTTATGTVLQTMTPSRGSGTTWSTTASTLAQGTYTAVATQTDTSGNTGTSAPSTFKVDTTAPTAVSISANNTAGGTAGRERSSTGLRHKRRAVRKLFCAETQGRMRFVECPLPTHCGH